MILKITVNYKCHPTLKAFGSGIMEVNYNKQYDGKETIFVGNPITDTEIQERLREKVGHGLIMGSIAYKVEKATAWEAEDYGVKDEQAEIVHRWSTRYFETTDGADCASGMECSCGVHIHQMDVEAIVNLFMRDLAAHNEGYQAIKGKRIIGSEHV